MPAPTLELVHLKTSKQYNDNNTLINRFWFQWSNRKELGNLVIRIQMLDADGSTVTETSVRLPKVKVNSYTSATETEPQRPIYDSTVWIQIDDIVREKPVTAFRYYTVVGFSKKSDRVTAAMDGINEDISHLG